MHVLVVDDEELIIEFLERSLRLDKHVVDTAINGTEALSKATRNSYDVIVLDVIMPDKNGLEVCEELRKKSINTPIILLTSKEDESSLIEGLDSGADDYLTKPFSYKELEARIRAVTRRPKSVKQVITKVGPLNLDPAKKIVSLDGKPVDLRPKEYTLLEYLMRNPSKVIAKDDLLKKVWRISSNNASNRLEVCMYHIRSKINNDERQLVKTVRGHGYMIEEA